MYSICSQLYLEQVLFGMLLMFSLVLTMNSPSSDPTQPIITQVVSSDTTDTTTSVESKQEHKPSKLPLNSKKVRVLLAGLFLVLLVVGGGTALYLSQVNQDIRNQAAVTYGQCPPGYGGSLDCNPLGGGECSGYESCHLPGGYDDCEPLPGSNQCLYSYQGSKCIGQCPGNMPPGYKRCHCSNGVWTIGTGASCDQLCKCTGNDCTTCTPTPPRDRTPTPTSRNTPTPTSTLITATPTATPTQIITPSITLTPTDGPSPTPTLTPTPIVGPQCHDIRMYYPGGEEITGDMDQALRPGESVVQFRCNATGGTPDRYEFRVLRPDGQIEDGDTNPALQAVGAITGEYLLTQSGTYYAQCRICTQDECHPFEDLPALTTAGCQTDSDCEAYQFCYQPPMPTCPPGQSCIQVMPPAECRDRAD